MLLLRRLNALSWFLIPLVPLVSSLRISGALGGLIAGSRVRPFRQEINEFSRSGPSWDLFVLALQRFQNTSITDELSYFQVAGIHGYPARPWDGVVGENVDQGFCMHNSVLFPVWHRPYLALYEQILSGHAHTIASDYPSNQQSRYVAAAETLRIPYWDWAINPRLPDVVTSPTLSIITPNGLQEISNPLLQYSFPVNMLQNGYFPSSYNVSGAPFTIRNLDLATGESNQAAASANLIAHSAQSLSKVYELFVSAPNYTFFSSYTGGLGSSLEGIHGNIHNDVGGGGFWPGHMTIILVSSYDPVFWLHHANVDRLLAIWQAIYPNDYVEPTINPYGTYYQPDNQIDTIDTPLAPFHSDDESTMWTAASARDTAVFGYTYPELVDWNISTSDLSSQVRQRVNELYSPPARPNANNMRPVDVQHSINVAQALSNIDADKALALGAGNLQRQWYLRVTVNGTALEDGAAVYFFVDEPDTASSTWSRAPNLIGTSKPYLPTRAQNGGNMNAQQADVSFSHTIATAVMKGILADISPNSVLPFLAQYLTWRCTDRDDTEMDDRSKRAIKIEVLSRAIEPRKSMVDFPLYGPYEKHKGAF